MCTHVAGVQIKFFCQPLTEIKFVFLCKFHQLLVFHSLKRNKCIGLKHISKQSTLNLWRLTQNIHPTNLKCNMLRKIKICNNIWQFFISSMFIPQHPPYLWFGDSTKLALESVGKWTHQPGHVVTTGCVGSSRTLLMLGSERLWFQAVQQCCWSLAYAVLPDLLVTGYGNFRALKDEC